MNSLQISRYKFLPTLVYKFYMNIGYSLMDINKKCHGKNTPMTCENMNIQRKNRRSYMVSE